MSIFLSYPKSGRTWVRFMIDSYLCHINNFSCENVFDAENLIKQTQSQYHIDWTHLTGAMMYQRPYWAMGPINTSSAQNDTWLFLTRNFQATLASAFFQARDRIRVFSGSPAEFLRDPRYGAIKLVTFYNMWEEIRTKLTCAHLFAYEQMLLDVNATFRQMLNALQLPIQEHLIDQVIEVASFDRMKSLSTHPAYRNTPLAPTDPDRPETYKVRQGSSDGSIFSTEDTDFIQRVADDLFIAKEKSEYRYCLGTPMKKSELTEVQKQKPQDDRDMNTAADSRL